MTCAEVLARPMVLALVLAACSDRHEHRDDIRVVDARAQPTPMAILPRTKPSAPSLPDHPDTALPQLGAPMIVNGEATDRPLPPELRHLETLGADQSHISQEEMKP